MIRRPPAWRRVGESTTMEFYVDDARPRVLFVWPRERACETGPTAVQTRAFIHRWFRERRGAVVVYLDRLVEIDREARRAHTQVYGETLVGAAYIGGTPLSRALMAFFLGLRPLHVPVRLFEASEDGLAWLDELLQEDEG